MLGAVAWLVRSIILHYLDKDVEAYKSELRLIEFRSTTLHDKRAQVIAELYGKLAIAVESAEHFVNSGIAKGQEERAKKTEADLIDFKSYFDRHRIYFDDATCKLLDDFYKHTHDPAMAFDVTVAISSQLPDRQLIFDTRRQSLKTIRETAKPIRIELENEFRRILGVVDG